MSSILVPFSHVFVSVFYIDASFVALHFTFSYNKVLFEMLRLFQCKTYLRRNCYHCIHHVLAHLLPDFRSCCSKTWRWSSFVTEQSYIVCLQRCVLRRGSRKYFAFYCVESTVQNLSVCRNSQKVKRVQVYNGKPIFVTVLKKNQNFEKIIF